MLAADVAGPDDACPRHDPLRCKDQWFTVPPQPRPVRSRGERRFGFMLLPLGGRENLQLFAHDPGHPGSDRAGAALACLRRIQPIDGITRLLRPLAYMRLRHRVDRRLGPVRKIALVLEPKHRAARQPVRPMTRLRLLPTTCHTNSADFPTSPTISAGGARSKSCTLASVRSPIYS